MTFYYSTRTWNSQPQLTKETINLWKHLSEKKNCLEYACWTLGTSKHMGGSKTKNTKLYIEHTHPTFEASSNMEGQMFDENAKN